MKKSFAWLSLAALIGLNSAAWSANGAAAGASRPALLTPVSKSWAVSLRSFARSQRKQDLPHDPDMSFLKTLKVGDARERAGLGPLVRSLTDRGYTPARFAALDPADRRHLMVAFIGNDAMNAVIGEANRLTQAAADEKAPASRLSKTIQEIGRIRRLVHLYAPFKEDRLERACAHASAIFSR